MQNMDQNAAVMAMSSCAASFKHDAVLKRWISQDPCIKKRHFILEAYKV